MPPVVKVGDQMDLVPTKEYPYGHFPFEKFNPVQSRIFDFYDKETSAIIAAATSAGKAQPLTANVLTPSGYIQMGEVKIGSKVIGSDGLPHNVVGVYPQGRKQVYRVHFSDGAYADCCEEHLWAIRTKSDKNRNSSYKIRSLKELFGKLKDKDGQNKWYIPLMEFDVESPEGSFAHTRYVPHYPIHPYALGVLLGDGGIKHRVLVSSADEYIINRLRGLLGDDVLVEYLQKYDYQIVGGMEEVGCAHGFMRTNLIKSKLESLGLFGHGSCDKFIPSQYMDGNAFQRIDLLRGLMDTDGSANGAKAAEFTSCSIRLAEGVLNLVRSLGGSAKMRRGSSSYVKDGIRITCRDRYRVTVNIGRINPFSMPRKAEAQQVGLEKGRNRLIDHIEVMGTEQCQCISVDATDHLYVTDNYVLTHNTVTAEMFLAHEIRKRGGKGMYLAPLRALAQEKIDDWTDPNHHFGDLNLSICTGDYRLTPKRKTELEKANMIVMTSEMLNSRCRNFSEEKNGWIKDVGTLVVDESHLLTVPGRGDHLEAGLMKFTELNPKVRLVLLSATMPNVDEISDWVSYILTHRDTVLLSSTYRPCPLNLHYEKYWDGEKDYESNEEQKVLQAHQIVEYYSGDKFLVFAHTKRTGEMMKQSLLRSGIQCEFHNADLDKAKRNKLEKQFKQDPKLRVIIATSTLAWGLNLPARRVIVLGVHRGMSEVATYDIFQMIGRAGRPSYDPVGDAYVLLPERQYDIHKERMKKPQRIDSQMLDKVGEKHKVMAFHLVSEVYNGNIKDKDDVHHWYKRSLACFQAHEFDDSVVDGVMELLKKCGAIWEEGGQYTVTTVGKVASMFYYSPFDVSDLRRNFKLLFDNGKEDDDYYLSKALGDTDTARCGIVSRVEREEMGRYATQINNMFGNGVVFEPAIKAGFAYHMLLNGHSNNHFSGYMRGLQFDFQRMSQVLLALDSFGGKWGKKEWFRQLQMRISYGVKGPMAYLCQLPDIGKVRATKLWAAGLKSVEDVANNPARVRAALGMKAEKVEEIITAAKTLLLTAF